MLAHATGDPVLAEDAAQDAFAAALARWPVDGPPRNPAAWIMSAARNRAVDVIRRGRVHDRAVGALAALAPLAVYDDEHEDAPAIPDERLALVFACCHPALAADAQVALTLRLVAGLSTADIAAAFLVPEATMAQRLVRAKAKVRDAGIPVSVPDGDALPERRDAVLAVVYLVFNAGYSDAGRGATAREAVRLGRMLVELMPADAEAHGLLALMLLQESRRAARWDPAGDIVLLQDQDRALWDTAAVAEGVRELEAAMTRAGGGPYVVQAAIAACHAMAARSELTDWRRIVALYGALSRMTGSPVVELNRGVAVALSGDPEGALPILDAVAGRLDGYHALHAARADVLVRLDRRAEAAEAYRRARDLAPTDEERRHMEGRLEGLAGDAGAG